MSEPTPVSTLYVHAPFCARRCRYCDFAVSVRRRGEPGPWARAIALELDRIVESGVARLDRPLATLYVGGGTPSLLGPEAMALLLGSIGGADILGPHTEWTAEANPESFAPEVADAWRAAGLNRISLGVQSFDEDVLRWMGRLHGAAGAERAVVTARAAGFDNLSLDLIFGLPSSLSRSWSEDLRRAIECAPEHVSLYGLTAESGTPLGRDVAAGIESLADEERYREEYLEAVETLRAAGYRHYEVSNFARPGRESRHNSTYWTGAPYLGLGNGAHSFLPPLRRWNLREWEAYSQAVAEGSDPVVESEVADPEAARLEAIWLSLRTEDGLRVARASEAERSRFAEWADRGWAEVEGDTVRLTPEGWLLLDELAVRLASAEEVPRS